MERGKSDQQRTPSERTSDDQRERDDRAADEHIVDNLLPPGIDFDEAKDPGSKTPRVPADNRS